MKDSIKGFWVLFFILTAVLALLAVFTTVDVTPSKTEAKNNNSLVIGEVVHKKKENGKTNTKIEYDYILNFTKLKTEKEEDSYYVYVESKGELIKTEVDKQDYDAYQIGDKVKLDEINSTIKSK